MITSDTTFSLRVTSIRVRKDTIAFQNKVLEETYIMSRLFYNSICSEVNKFLAHRNEVHPPRKDYLGIISNMAFGYESSTQLLNLCSSGGWMTIYYLDFLKPGKM